MKTLEQWMNEIGSTEAAPVFIGDRELPPLGRISIVTKDNIKQIQSDAQAELKVELEILKEKLRVERGYNDALKQQISELTTERDNARGLLGKSELELAELKKLYNELHDRYSLEEQLRSVEDIDPRKFKCG